MKNDLCVKCLCFSGDLCEATTIYIDWKQQKVKYSDTEIKAAAELSGL